MAAIVTNKKSAPINPLMDPTKSADWQIAQEAEKSMKNITQISDELG